MNKYMIIDGARVEFTDEKNILDVVRKAGIELPTLCYYSELSVYGACRMCVVEDERGSIMASCSTPPKHKMVIRTNTPRLQKHRKMILELLLASHCRDCTVCEKNGKCKLQELAARFGIKGIRFPTQTDKGEIDASSKAIIREPSKCILCGDCVRMCNEIQHVGAIDFAFRGSNMVVSPAFNRSLAETDCVNCGQCAAVCPTGAIVIHSHVSELWNAIYDKNKLVVAQVAPAVRVALGEVFGCKPGEDVMGKIVTCLRRLGFDEVYDTSLTADLTIMEETKEFLKRLKNQELPLFTSCCPAWVSYVEAKHPDMIGNVSSCKSPMEMFGALIKQYLEEERELERKNIVHVAIMPCTAKKSEADREEFKKNGNPDVDIVITTDELSNMIIEAGIKFNEIDAEAADMPFSLHSGSGVIFGVTGGVAESVIRKLMEDKSSYALRELEFVGVRGMEGMKECEVPFHDKMLKIGVVSGLGNAHALMKKIKSGEVHYDFVEVMACPGGCICGAGQPFALSEMKRKRAKGIYKADKLSQFKRSEENPMMATLYNGILKNREKQLLHVHYKNK